MSNSNTEFNTTCEDEYPSFGNYDNTGNSMNYTFPKISSNSPVKTVSSSSRDGKVVKVLAKNVPKNMDKFLNNLKKNLNDFSANIMSNKLSTGDYNITVRAPNEKLSDAVSFIQHVFQPKVIKKLKLDQKHYDDLTRDNKYLLMELLEDNSTNVDINLQSPSTILFKGTEFQVTKAQNTVTEYINKLISNDTECIENIPQIYHPFIRGSFNSNITKILEKCNNEVQISIPSPELNNRKITISGPEEYRTIAREEIQNIYRISKKGAYSKTLKIPVAYQSKIKRACGIDKILNEKKVALSFPFKNNQSENVIFVGIEENIADAYQLALERGRTYSYLEVPCKMWIFNLVKKNENCSFTVLKEHYPNLWISYLNSKESVALDGPSEIVEAVARVYKSETSKIESVLSMKTFKMPSIYIRGMCESDGSLLEEIRKITNTNIEFRSCKTSPDTIANIDISGSNENVETAYSLMQELSEKQTQNMSRDIVIDSYYMNKILEKFASMSSLHEELQSTFGSNLRINLKNNKPNRTFSVLLNGKRGAVMGAASFINELLQTIKEKFEVMEVEVPNAYHSLIIGKKRAILQELISSSGVDNIIAPGTDSTYVNPNIVYVMGTKETCKIAKIMIFGKCNIDQNNMDQINVTLDREICEKLQIGNRMILRKLIASSLSDVVSYHDFHSKSVNVMFPKQALTSSNSVRIQGQKESVSKVANKLSSLKNETFVIDHFDVRSSMIKVIIGKGGSKIKQLIGDVNVDVIFPSNKSKRETDENTNDDETMLTVYMIGNSSKDLLRVKSSITKFVKEFEDQVEVDVEIPSKYQRKLMGRKNDDESILMKISSNHPGVRVIFTKEDTVIILKGPSKLVDQFRNEVINYIQKWNNTVTDEFIIPLDHCHILRRKEAPNFDSIATANDVSIKSYREGEKLPGGQKPKPDSKVRVIIEGLQKNVMLAKKLIMDLEPETSIIDIPKVFHSSLIGQKGVGFKKLVEGLNVNITFPQFDNHSSEVVIRGSKEAVKDAAKRLDTAYNELKKKQTEWERVNHIVELEIDRKWYAKIIGKAGRQIQNLKKQTGVNIIIPNNDKTSNKVVLKGEEKLCIDAQNIILKMVSDWEKLIEEIIHIPKIIHRRLRGFKSSNVNELQKKYNVEIRFASIDDESNDSIKITGFPENVEKAKKDLENSAKLFLSEMADNTEEDFIESKSLENFSFRPVKSRTVVAPAPVELPNSESLEHMNLINVESSENELAYSNLPFGEQEPVITPILVCAETSNEPVENVSSGSLDVEVVENEKSQSSLIISDNVNDDNEVNKNEDLNE